MPPVINSDPNFITPITNPFGLTDVGYSAKPTFADIDNDGDLDAFVGNFDGNTQFYRNTGTAAAPTFTQEATNPFGLTDVGYFAAPTFADIDGDGDLDAFVGNGSGNTLFYRNTGTAAAPTFTQEATNAFGLTDVGSNAAPTFADIDNDGDLDAFVGNRNGNTLFYRNTGTAAAPTFTLEATNPFGLTDVGSSASPTFADIDGDGDLDAFVGNGSGNTLFFRNTGTAAAPAFTQEATNPFGLTDVGSFVAPTFADIDGDGDLDAFVGNYDGDTLFFENTSATTPTGDPNFIAPITNPFGLTDVGSNAAPTFADIDGDGDLDAFVGNQAGNTVFYRNTGTAAAPTFTLEATNPFGLTNVVGLAKATFADIDGDGDLDAFVGNKDGNTVFYRNTGTAAAPTFTQEATNPFGLTDVGYFATPTFADIDGDGDLDAFVGNQAGNTVFHRNTGTAAAPTFTQEATNPFGLTDVGSNAAPTLADIDNDGDLDAFVGNRDGNTQFYRNTGTAAAPTFTLEATNPFGLTDVGLSAAPTFADIDGDGDLDAFVGNRYGNTLFFENGPTTPVNNAPTGSPTATLGNTAEDTAIIINAADLLAGFSDVDAGDTLSVANLTANNGTLVDNLDGTYTFTPTANFNGAVTLSYGVTDGTDTLTGQTQTFSVTPVNDVATITGTATASVTEDTATPNLTATGSLTVSDADAGENIFNTTVTSASGNLGSLSITNAGAYSYSVANSAVQFLGAGQTKAETFTVNSVDGTASKNITVTINGVNDAPTVANAVPDKTTIENSGFNFTVPANTFADVDTSNTLTYTATLDNGNALPSWLTFNATTRTFSGTPAAANVGTIGVKVTAKDNSNATVSDIFNLTVTPLNLTGTPNADILTGTASNNTINGLAGNDTITGNKGNDTITGGTGQDRFVYNLGDGVDTITDFGGVGQGVNPTAAVIAATDTLKFQGAGLTAQNLLLTKNGSNLEVSFESVANSPKVILQNFALENLDNLLKSTGASVDLGNILFNGQTTIQDSFDVFDVNSTQSNLLNQNSVTFLNDLNNSVNGFDNSADVINGQGGNDYIDGKSGNDLLRGGAGNDTLIGGSGNDILVGGADNDSLTGGSGNDQFVYQAFSDKGTTGDTITDFNQSQDKLVLTVLFQSLGYSGSNPISDGYLRFVQSGTSTRVQVDANGGADALSTLTTLNNFTATNLVIGGNVLV